MTKGIWPDAELLTAKDHPIHALELAFRRRDEARALERAAPALLALVRAAVPHMADHARWSEIAEHALAVADGHIIHLDPEICGAE